MWLWGTSEIAALVTVHMGKLMPMIGKDLRQRRGQVQDSGPGALLYSWSLTSPPPAARLTLKKVLRGVVKRQMWRIQIPAPSLTTCVTLGKLLSLPGPQLFSGKGWGKG